MTPGDVAKKEPNRAAYIMAETGQAVSYSELEYHANQTAQLQLGPQQWLLYRHSGARLRVVRCLTTRTVRQRPAVTADSRFSGARSGKGFGRRCATALSAVAMPPKRHEGKRSFDR